VIFYQLVVVPELHIVVAVLLESFPLFLTAEQLVAQLVLAVHHTDSKQHTFFLRKKKQNFELIRLFLCSCGSTAAYCGAISYGNCGYSACGSGLCCTRYG
jgi:hypothetical protein